MSEEIYDQVSAFMDEELSGEECAFLVRRLERDPAARSKLVSYSLIGCVLRRELAQPDPDMLRRRVHEALNGVTPALKPSVAAKPSWQRRLATPAVGVGIAATVALASLFVFRTVNDARDASSEFSSPAASGLADNTSPSYIVPQQSESPIRLTNYLVRHGEYTSLLSRTSVHSNVVGGFDGPIVDVSDELPSSDSGASTDRKVR